MTIKAAGLTSGFACYLFWGLAPIYWKTLDKSSGIEIISNRIIWSFLFLLLIIIIQKRMGEITAIFKNRRTVLLLLCSSLLININWGTYIITVNAGHVVEASLGYYINPFVSMLLGIIFFRERMDDLQIFAVSLAALGVVIFIYGTTGAHIAPLMLAFSFAAYGAVKKYTPVMPIPGLLVETMLTLPIAVGYLIFLEKTGQGSLGHYTLTYDFLLIISGLVTSLPMLAFTFAVRRLQLITIGILQFIAPAASLCLGVFLYHEPFTSIHLITFGLMWVCVALFIYDGVMRSREETALAK